MKKGQTTIKNYYKDFLTTIIKEKAFIIPLVIIFLIFIIGFIFNYFADETKYLTIDMEKAYIIPSFKYPFGTNNSGQNQLYIVFVSAYHTILLAVIVTMINLLVGIVVGVFWGVSEKFAKVMFIIKNFVDSTPLIYFYIIIAMIFKRGFLPLILVVILFGWLEFAYLIRNNILIIKNKDYNKVSQIYNVSLFKRTVNNYLPPILPLIFNNIILSIPKIISLEIIISYFGFSLGGYNYSLGTLIYNSISNSTYYTHSYMFFIPFLILFIVNLCMYFISKTISVKFSKEEF